MTNTAELARKLPTEARYALLRIAVEPTSQRSVHPALTAKALVNVIDGDPSVTELGVRVLRHLDAGHQVQVRGAFLRIVERVLAAQTVDAEIEQEFRARFTTTELDTFMAALSHVCAAARAAGKD